MMKRLAVLCFVAMLLIGVSSPLLHGQDSDVRRATPRDISALSVVVEELPNGAKMLGLSNETIQTDVELKLRLAGIRVVSEQEDFKLPGMPTFYVRVNVMDAAEAARIDVELEQNVSLVRNGESAVGIPTWSTGMLVARPSLQGIRNDIKDLVDEFLNAWLSVNPKK